MAPPSSGEKSKPSLVCCLLLISCLDYFKPWRWRWYIHPKCWALAKLHGTTTKEAISSRPSLVKWDLWWTKWRRGRFSLSTSVSPASLHSAKFSILTITWGRYNRPEVADMPSGPSLDSTPHYANFKGKKRKSVILIPFKSHYSLHYSLFLLFLQIPRLFSPYIHIILLCPQLTPIPQRRRRNLQNSGNNLQDYVVPHPKRK
jgi:hypothetical protein